MKCWKHWIHWVMKWASFPLNVLGHIIAYAATTAVLLNFCMQCEMLVFFANCILSRLAERSLDLTISIKVCLHCKSIDLFSPFMIDDYILLIKPWNSPVLDIGNNFVTAEMFILNIYLFRIFWIYFFLFRIFWAYVGRSVFSMEVYQEWLLLSQSCLANCLF